MLSIFFYPLVEPAPVLFQQKASYPETLTEDPMRLGIARRAWDPLFSNLILAGCEPLLRQHFNQSRL
jgi:hypothetical protein